MDYAVRYPRRLNSIAHPELVLFVIVKQSGACTDLSLWPSAIKKVDFIGQSESCCLCVAIRAVAEPCAHDSEHVPEPVERARSRLDTSCDLLWDQVRRTCLLPALTPLLTVLHPEPYAYSDFGDSKSVSRPSLYPTLCKCH